MPAALNTTKEQHKYEREDFNRSAKKIEAQKEGAFTSANEMVKQIEKRGVSLYYLASRGTWEDEAGNVYRDITRTVAYNECIELESVDTGTIVRKDIEKHSV